jgi:voltage-gated potassium channel Kch
VGRTESLVVTDHILVIGYGETGRRAVNSVLASQPDARLTVLDTDFLAVAEATANGATAVRGDGRDRCALGQAGADIADRVFVAVPDDLDAFLITRAVWPLNPDRDRGRHPRTGEPRVVPVLRRDVRPHQTSRREDVKTPETATLLPEFVLPWWKIRQAAGRSR